MNILLPVITRRDEVKSMTSPTSQRPPSGPDFLCIGAQKAGTGWLYEQLRSHPDFWMPPMKEVHYFDRLAVSDAAMAVRSLPILRSANDRIRIARERARDDRDREFLRRFERIGHQQSIDLDGYADLFGAKGIMITGDITPGYSILPPPAIGDIVRRFPSLKIIFIARDPVERAWSQISMYVRRGLINRFDPSDPDRINEQLKRPEILARSYPAEIVHRWRSKVNPELFRVYFFDDLKRDPISLRASIVTFLGGDPQKKSGELAPEHNAKAKKEKLVFTDAARSALAQFFERELQACAKELGGPAAEWPKRYGF
jgi:hypothetical protein